MAEKSNKYVEDLNLDIKTKCVNRVVCGVRITPSEFHFKNYSLDDVQVRRFTIQNISSKNANIVISKPDNASLYFVDGKEKERYVLFPGLVISKYLAYYTQKNDMSSFVKIIINEEEIALPIQITNCAANIVVHPESLDFGILNIGGKFVDRTLTILNSGSLATKFAIIVGTNPMHVEPKYGYLKPSQKIQIRFRAAGVKMGQQRSSIWIECSSSIIKFVNVTITSIVPCLMIHHPVKKGNTTVLNFGAVYYGTCSYESFIVRNYSAEQTIFILTVEHNKQRQVYMEVEDDKLKKWLHVWPFHGTLHPFESMVFSICFRPSKVVPKLGWKHKNPNSDDVIWAYLKVEDVTQKPLKTKVEEKFSKKRGSLRIQKLKSTDAQESTICIHGKAERADIIFEPDSISMYAVVGQQDRSTVKLINPSLRLPVHFEFIKTPYITTIPVSGIIEPSRHVDILLIFRAKSLGSLSCKLCYNVKSYCNLTDQEEMITLKKKAIPLQLYTESVSQQPKPQFNLGITPHVANEVGVHTDNIKFTSDLTTVPRAATVISLNPDIATKFWFRRDPYTIAFPNDMARKIYEKPHDETKRTIYKGTPRYLPPSNPKEAMTDFEIYLMNDRRKVAREFIRSFAEVKTGTDRQSLKLKSLSQERLQGLLTVPCRTVPEIKPIHKANLYIENVASLTPIQLFNVSITPTNFNFGLIPVGVNCSITLTFENENNFPIHFNFIFDEKLVFPKKLLLGPMGKISQQLGIRLKFTGKYISCFNYIICDIHKFHKTVRAEAVQSFLKFFPTTIEFTIPKYMDMFQPCYEPVYLKNPFSSPTKFEWQVSQKHVVEMVPESGIIRENDTLTCLLYVHKFFKTRKKINIKLQVGETANSILTCFIPAFSDYRVTPISHVLNIKTIAAGIKIVKPFYLFNYGAYKTTYFVRSTFPIDGVEVHPRCGVIAPKSLETLEVSLRLECLMIINFDILIDIEGTITKKIQLLGNVSFPTVEFQPNTLNFITTKCYSFSTQPVVMTNKTNEDAVLTFEMQKFEQFRITTTPLHHDPEITSEGLTLKGNCSQTIYVHFKPEHIASYEFYLPICINDFLGPPVADQGGNKSVTFMSTTSDKPYLKRRSTKPYILSSHFNTILKPPDYFDAVWVTCVVRPPEITFSSLQLDLESIMPEQSTSKKVIISNPTDKPVTIQVGKTSYPFNLKTLEDRLPPYVIPAKEKLEMLATFKPYKTGSWSAAIPISIVKGGNSTHYNDLMLSGLCHPSSLYCQTSELYMIPVPLGTKIDKRITIYASHQREDTDVKMMIFCKTNIERKIGVEFPDSPHIPKNTDGVAIPITISFLSVEATSFEVKLIFRDGMEGEMEITMYATATDSLIPNHWFYYTYQTTEVEDEEYMKADYRSASLGSRDSNRRSLSIGPVGWRDSEITDVVNMGGRYRYSSVSVLMLPCGVKSDQSTLTFSEEEHIYYWSKIYLYVTRWLLYSVFSGAYQPKLGDITWSKSFMEQIPLKPPMATTKTFIDLIIALFGSEILAKTNLSSESPGLDDLVRINYCLKAYAKILGHLDVYGVGLSHISPLYLLNYQDYCKLYEWKKNKVQGAPLYELPLVMKSKKEFDIFSKKMWLEFYLQLFKSHTMDTCVGLAIVDDWPKVRRGTIQSTMTLSEHHSMAFDRMNPISKIITGDMLDQVNQDRSHSEAVLMAWLSRTYNKVRDDGTLELPPLEDDKVMDLGMNLRNGVILAGVTAYYCPFLVKILSEINFQQTTDVEIWHNANHLILAWDEVKLGLMVKSEDILECNPIFMMMLVAHLYLSLPSFLPAYLLRAAVPLADAGTTVLSVSNQSNFELRYYVKLYQDSHEPFCVLDEKPYYIVKPKGTVNISVHFVSNRIGKVTGLLLLCGANGPYIHGINMCIKLEGEPTLINVSNKIVVKLPMYQQVFFHQKIFSPYNRTADYDLAISIAKPSLDMRYIYEWKTRNKCMFPLMVVSSSKTLTVPVYPNYGTLQLACCCFLTTQVVRWITFNSPTAGDFVCKVILEPQEESHPQSFTIEFPMAMSSDLSSVKEEAFIPIELEVPCANLSLVKTSLDMLSLMVRFDELYFYRKYWGRYIGLKLFEQEVLSLCPSLIQFLKIFFQNSVTYEITCDSPLVDVQKTITIQDVHSEESVVLPIRLKTGIVKPFSAMLKLSWKQSYEQRSYQLNFVPVSKVNSKIKK